jgi:putative ABC transport system permease protein
MFKLNLKIALRNLWKNKSITVISIGGLSIALAAFILVMLYATYETTYDKELPAYENIYLVGRSLPDMKTNYTPPPLGRVIKANCPEIEVVGTMKNSGFEFAANNGANTIFIKSYLLVDYNAASMFHLQPDHGLERPAGKNERFFYLKRENMQALFPDKKDNKPEMVSLGSRTSGQTAKINGAINTHPHSNISFEALSIANEIGGTEDYGYNNYYTYIQVKPGTIIANLEEKITRIYKTELIKAGGNVHDQRFTATSIFLDPLKNLHLKPTAGNDANYKVVMALFVLGILILVIACINFTNLSIAQANKRAKEVGVKKVLGAYRHQLTLQFLTEILIQCTVAVIIGLTLAELVLPLFNNLFGVPLSLSFGYGALIWQLPLILLFITLVAGVYPAIVLSGFKPARVLKGNFQTSRETQWLRNSLLVVQLGIAVTFIAGLLVITTQLKYMRTEDVGFKAEQVVYIKNIAYYNKPADFAPIREKIMKIPGVQLATVTSALPDGSKTGSNEYTANGKHSLIEFLDVDFDYFETLGIKLQQGRFFSADFKTDTVSSAILNESAVAKFGLMNPVGEIISGCGIDYKIVGVIKDFKAQGFDHAVEPTIYALKNPCGNGKTQIMLKIEQHKMAGVLAALSARWLDINKKDGENFRYEFLDALYGKLFKQQEQLQAVFFAATILTIVIAVLGLFAFARYMTNNRIKEIAVRKILGASDLQILKLLNSSFVIMVLIANCISWPVAYILTKKWLESFAYSITVPVMPFVLAAVFSLLLTLVTVTIQAGKAIRANPIDALKYE